MNLGDLEFKATWNPLYSVAADGRIRNNRSGRILKQVGTGDGYKCVTFSSGSKRQTVRVQKAVAFAFLGPRPQSYEINHIDGNKANNHLDNIEYVTCLENQRHAIALGKKVREANGKLSPDQVWWIKRKWDSKRERAVDLAARLGVHVTSVYYAKAGRTWTKI